MDENSVPEKNVAQNSGGNKSSYEVGEGSGNVNLVEGHNRSSGEVGESSVNAQQQHNKHISSSFNSIVTREMIFVQPFYDNFCDNFISHTHIKYLFYLSITLIFVSISTFSL